MRPEEERVKDWKEVYVLREERPVRHKARAVWIVEYLFVIVEKMMEVARAVARSTI